MIRRTELDEPRDSTHPMPEPEKDHLAAAVLRILVNLDASLAASTQARFAATERSCCGYCGALYAGPSCDVCRACESCGVLFFRGSCDLCRARLEAAA